MSSLPQEEVPLVGCHGDKQRLKQLLYQLPPHDNDASYCNQLSSCERKELKQFSSRRRREALGRGRVVSVKPEMNGVTCFRCRQKVDCDALVVLADRLPASVWHVACFRLMMMMMMIITKKYETSIKKIISQKKNKIIKTLNAPRCMACDHLLVELVYFRKGDGVMCGRHHAETIKPRCMACDEVG